MSHNYTSNNPPPINYTPAYSSPAGGYGGGINPEKGFSSGGGKNKKKSIQSQAPEVKPEVVQEVKQATPKYSGESDAGYNTRINQILKSYKSTTPSQEIVSLGLPSTDTYPIASSVKGGGVIFTTPFGERTLYPIQSLEKGGVLYSEYQTTEQPRQGTFREGLFQPLTKGDILGILPEVGAGATLTIGGRILTAVPVIGRFVPAIGIASLAAYTGMTLRNIELAPTGFEKGAIVREAGLSTVGFALGGSIGEGFGLGRNQAKILSFSEKEFSTSLIRIEEVGGGKYKFQGVKVANEIPGVSVASIGKGAIIGEDFVGGGRQLVNTYIVGVSRGRPFIKPIQIDQPFIFKGELGGDVTAGLGSVASSNLDEGFLSFSKISDFSLTGFRSEIYTPLGGKKGQAGFSYDIGNELGAGFTGVKKFSLEESVKRGEVKIGDVTSFVPESKFVAIYKKLDLDFDNQIGASFVSTRSKPRGKSKMVSFQDTQLQLKNIQTSIASTLKSDIPKVEVGTDIGLDAYPLIVGGTGQAIGGLGFQDSARVFDLEDYGQFTLQIPRKKYINSFLSLDISKGKEIVSLKQPIIPILSQPSRSGAIPKQSQFLLQTPIQTQINPSITDLLFFSPQEFKRPNPPIFPRFDFGFGYAPRRGFGFGFPGIGIDNAIGGRRLPKRKFKRRVSLIASELDIRSLKIEPLEITGITIRPIIITSKNRRRR